MTATTETEVMLMQAVLEAPGDDGPRLVLADWYEENGQGERAEFVRLQISAANNPDEWPEFPNRLDTLIDVEQVPAKMLGIGPDWSWSGSRSGIVIRPSADGIKYIFRRGMVGEIECSALEWIGGPCRKCYIRREGEQIIRDGCNNCNWTGRVEGIARAVCERWPVTTVRLSDKRSDNGAFWKESSGDNPNDPSILPEKLFNIMSKMYPNRHRSINRRGFSETQSEHNIYFAAHPKSISADDALSLTAVNYGRDLAGLPPL